METLEKNEGELTKAIEKQTVKVPSSTFLFAAFGAIAMSLTLKMMGRRHDALFVGQWAAPILLFGIYNKLVKQEKKGSRSSSKMA